MSYPDPPNGVRSLEQRIRNLEGDQGPAADGIQINDSAKD